MGRRSCVTAGLWVVLLAATCTALVAAGLTPEQELIEWIRQSGGTVNVLVDTVDGVRGTYAAQDIANGSVIAIIPDSVTYKLTSGCSSNSKNPYFAESAAKIMQESVKSSSPWRAYWAGLPSKKELRSVYNFPHQYVQMLQAQGQEEYITRQQEALAKYWHENKKLEAQGHSYVDLQHAAGLVSTRGFSGEEGARLVPLLDMANHHNLCPNIHPLEECPHDRSALCWVWIAGRDYKKGEEVCNGYGGAFNDRAFITYGYVPDTPRPPALYGVDRHDYELDDIWSNNMWTRELPPPFNASTADGFLEEAEQLRLTLFYLKQADAQAAKEQPAPEDPEGAVLQLVLKWRALRAEALEAEIQRLRGEAQRLGGKVLSEEQYWKELEQQDAEHEKEMLEEEEEDAVSSQEDEDDPYADDDGSKDEL